MKKFLTVLLVGGLMAGSIFAFNASAPRAYQSQDVAPMYQNYQGVHGGYMFNDENLITLSGTIDSIEENKDFPGMLEIKVKTENGDIVEIHANSYFAKDIEVGKSIEVKGWEVEFADEKIFRPVETKIDGEEVLLNGYRGAARGMGAETTMPGYGKPVNNFRGNRGYAPNMNYRRPVNNFKGNMNYAPNMNYGHGRNQQFRSPMNYQNHMPDNYMPGYTPQTQPMPRGRW
ncbi:hypothetical protein [Marinitoga lauensis]|uniref:hypothetical protein n=1 Tax=Marinitoga lauensis TaxID=2201189 RepID=UPI001012AEA6|nr:hypothetical protein [Marinitoga lauensis]